MHARRIAAAALLCAVAATGCQTSSHRSSRSYEYEGPERAPAATEPQGSEYEMQSPGSMTNDPG